MKFACNREEMAKVLSVLKMATGGSRPATNSVLMEASEANVRVQATNLDIYASASIDIEHMDNNQCGDMCMPIQLLSKIISDSTAEKLVFSAGADGNHVIEFLAADGHRISKASITGIMPDEYPGMQHRITSGTVVAADALAHALGFVAPAVAAQSVQYVMTGVNIKTNEQGELHLACTDTHRLHHITMHCSDVSPIDATTLIGGVNIARAALKQCEEGEVCLATDEENKAICWRIGKYTITSQNIQGRYPKYLDIIPKPESITMKSNIVCDDLAHALKHIRHATNANDKAAKFVFSADELIISATNDIGNIVCSVDCESDIAGGAEFPPLTICTNYILDAIQSLGFAQVNAYFKDAKSPILMRPIDRDDIDVVIMPIAPSV